MIFYTWDKASRRISFTRDWRKAFRADRQVAVDTVAGYLISTVFLPIDHNFFEKGFPILFETAVFTNLSRLMAPRLEGEIQRYCTYEEAMAGHQLLCAKYRSQFEDSVLKGLLVGGAQ